MNDCHALPRADFLDPAEIRSLQQSRWARQAAYIGAASAAWAERRCQAIWRHSPTYP
jgi:hypothetical protein